MYYSTVKDVRAAPIDAISGLRPPLLSAFSMFTVIVIKLSIEGSVSNEILQTVHQQEEYSKRKTALAVLKQTTSLTSLSK